MVRMLEPTGIIDIGSNSVRFVVFAGSERVPSTLFNEKISPALGRGVEREGRLDPVAMERALDALSRFACLADDMRLKRLHVVATAAVRDAENGADFLKMVRRLGLKAKVLSGEEEAEIGALGVLSAIPQAEGVVADLGGGSLELTRVSNGAVAGRLSLPLGVFRIGALSTKKLAGRIGKAIEGLELGEREALYLVGGSFRALARLDQSDLQHPLPIVHHHRIAKERLPLLEHLVATTSEEELKRITMLSANRIEILLPAMSVLDALVAVFEPREIVVSAFGLREGLIYRDLDAAKRASDPLLEAALEIGETLGRFGDHGALIDQWIAPLFPNDDSAHQRIRLAACLMSDVAWNAHPDFRAERAVDMALHGNFVAIDAHGRALLGHALSHAFGSDYRLPPGILSLLEPDEADRAAAWGRAIRLAQRLSGGAEKGLMRTSLQVTAEELVLCVNGPEEFVGETAARRLSQLAKALGLKERILLD
ncbi:Ppx/GppA family phosphatase [Sphingomonas sp. HDW15A]|uniref:Ppx/GppA family phosphatase n=1 Tax=Sphingomonas sp. HDW15A TaxID=2714942 RepID=UPI0014085D73|nr:Ppx/GppA family phosphatase [Sphingomonas sp. HDW15A]QIK96150.1 Ppx/GppA family phosphatase [Sphingomonas sp. HDW15A]